MDPIWQSLTPAQRADLRHWAANGLVRLWEAGAVSFEYLCDIQAWAGVE